jgi:hypothetical protein
MASIDPRIDAYITASPEFARPILTHLREVVHAACPEVEETMKWSSPHFLYKGMLCHMAAFKAHCAFGFWKGTLLFPDLAEKDAMGHLGRIRSLKGHAPAPDGAGHRMAGRRQGAQLEVREVLKVN